MLNFIKKSRQGCTIYTIHHKKYITSAGGVKSFETALYLCEYLYGKDVVKSLDRGLVID